MDLHYTDPAHDLRTVGYNLDDVDRDLCELSVQSVNYFVPKTRSEGIVLQLLRRTLGTGGPRLNLAIDLFASLLRGRDTADLAG